MAEEAQQYQSSGGEERSQPRRPPALGHADRAERAATRESPLPHRTRRLGRRISRRSTRVVVTRPVQRCGVQEGGRDAVTCARHGVVEPCAGPAPDRRSVPSHSRSATRVRAGCGDPARGPGSADSRARFEPAPPDSPDRTLRRERHHRGPRARDLSPPLPGSHPPPGRRTSGAKVTLRSRSQSDSSVVSNSASARCTTSSGARPPRPAAVSVPGVHLAPARTDARSSFGA